MCLPARHQHVRLKTKLSHTRIRTSWVFKLYSATQQTGISRNSNKYHTFLPADITVLHWRVQQMKTIRIAAMERTLPPSSFLARGGGTKKQNFSGSKLCCESTAPPLWRPALPQSGDGVRSDGADSDCEAVELHLSDSDLNLAGHVTRPPASTCMTRKPVWHGRAHKPVVASDTTLGI